MLDKTFLGTHGLLYQSQERPARSLTLATHLWCTARPVPSLRRGSSPWRSGTGSQPPLRASCRSQQLSLDTRGPPWLVRLLSRCTGSHTRRQQPDPVSDETPGYEYDYPQGRRAQLDKLRDVEPVPEVVWSSFGGPLGVSMQTGTAHSSFLSRASPTDRRHTAQNLRQERWAWPKLQAVACHVHESYDTHTHHHMNPYAAAKKKRGGGGSSLTEEEREVIDLSRVEAAMQAAIAVLKKEYTNTLVTRLTPSPSVQPHTHTHTHTRRSLPTTRTISGLVYLG